MESNIMATPDRFQLAFFLPFTASFPAVHSQCPNNKTADVGSDIDFPNNSTRVQL